MKTAEKIYIAVLLLIFILLGVIEYNTPLPVNWSESYSRYDKIPYGDYALYDMLEDMFPGKRVTTSELPLYRSLNDSLNNTNLIIINNSFNPDTLELRTLLNFVKRGNTAFIAADYYYGSISDSLKIQVTEKMGSVIATDSLGLNFMDDELFMQGKDYAYKKGSVDSYFDSCENSEVLSRNSNGKPVMIAKQIGRGKLLLSTVPKAFTNYYALKYPENDYIFKSLSYLPIADTRWDENYKMIERKASTPLRYILNNSALKRAYYLMIFALFIYILFEGKRKQRVIPVIKPLQNTSLEFTETIGRLYFQKGTNKGIAEKRIKYLYDYIRTKFKVNANDAEGEFYNSLSAKTLISITDLKELFAFIVRVQHQPEIDSPTLLQLNTLIEDFYKKTN